MIDFETAKDIAYEKLKESYNIEVLANDSIDLSKKYNQLRYWLVPIPVDPQIFGFEYLELIVGIPKEFPLVLPKIFLSFSHSNELLNLPHIDQNRFICTYDEERAIPNPDLPVELIQNCLYKAKKIIEAGVKGENIEDYKDEFVAYWHQTYNDEEKYIRVLSSISEEIEEGDTVSVLILNKKIGSFDSIVVGKCLSSNQIRKFLSDWMYVYVEYEVFYAGKINLGLPPYNLLNVDLNMLILKKPKSIQQLFYEFLNKSQDINLVLFDVGIVGDRRLQALQIDKLPNSANGFRKGKLSPKQAFKSVAKKKKYKDCQSYQFIPRDFKEEQQVRILGIKE